MDGERWQRIRKGFQAALETGPEARAAAVEEACGGEADLLAEVASLLAAHDAAESFLDVAEERLPEALLPGERIGPYQVAQKLGSGGMGEVYLAFRTDGELQRRVALKVLKPGLDSAEVIRRFRTERQILAALDHPHIARLLDAGTTGRGLPYFVMEYVEGQPIDSFCAERRLAIRQRLELFRAVCSAVQHAHRNLIVHRDLKPGNILVTAEGTPKLLDFGIAKLLNPELSSSAPGVTLLGLPPMTPGYASPEQLRGERVTTASDVYSLGVLLHELLTGSPPHGATAPSLGGDLDNVLAKALHQEADRRYSTVEQLSEDLLRWLEGRPVLARPRTAGYRAAKFVRRHRLGVSAAAALLLLILGFGIAMGLLAARLSRERDRARQEQRRAEHVEKFLTEIFAVSDPWRSTGETVTARQILDEGARRLDTELADEPVVRSDLMERVGMIYQRLGLPDRAQPLFAGSLATRRQLFGNEHPKVADALYGLALVAEDRGHFEEAIDLVQRALLLRRRWYGPEHEAVAQSRHKLGLLLRQQGDVAAAEEHLRAALSLRRQLSPPSPRDVADSLSGLGAVLWERGRYGEAEAAAREALALRQEVYGPRHPEVAVTLNLLAVIVAANGDLKQSESLLRETLALRRRLYPGDHPKTAESLNNLGALLKDRPESKKEAEAFFGEALAMRRRLFGEDHLSVATTLENLGWLALDRGDLATAARLQQESLDIRTRALGPSHRLVSDSLMALAAVRVQQGDFGAAENALREALALRREALGNRHLQVALSLEQLAILLVHQGRIEEAKPAALEALDIVRRMEPVVPERVAEAERVLAACVPESGT